MTDPMREAFESTHTCPSRRTLTAWEGFQEGWQAALSQLHITNRKCTLLNVESGSYEKTVILPRPKHMYPTERKDWVTVDECMVPEILGLWHKGVWTLECCCGHGRHKGYVAVTEESCSIMDSLGYEIDPEVPHVYLAKTHKNLPFKVLSPQDDVEKVAKALYEDNHFMKYEELRWSEQQEYRALAKAAIRAMWGNCG